jgi:hypothetical protein
VVKWGGGSVAVGERVAEAPHLAQRGDMEVCRCSSLMTMPSSTQGETMMAGTL